MKPLSFATLDIDAASRFLALLTLGLSLISLLGACSGVETTGSTEEADPLAAMALGMKVSSEAHRTLQPAMAQAAKPEVKSVPQPTEPAHGAKARSTLSDEQAAEIAIRLARGTATLADKQALHAYLETSR